MHNKKKAEFVVSERAKNDSRLKGTKFDFHNEQAWRVYHEHTQGICFNEFALCAVSLANIRLTDLYVLFTRV